VSAVTKNAAIDGMHTPEHKPGFVNGGVNIVFVQGRKGQAGAARLSAGGTRCDTDGGMAPRYRNSSSGLWEAIGRYSEFPAGGFCLYVSQPLCRLAPETSMDA
jgi:hypothetical protein